MEDGSDLPTGFSGVAGRAGFEALRPRSLFVGALLATALVAGNHFLLRFHEGASALAFTHMLLALAYGWGAAGAAQERSLGRVLTIAGRFMLLSLIWISPFLLLGLNLKESASLLERMRSGTPGGTESLLFALLILGTASTTPLFVIMASAGERIRDLFLPVVWRDLFDSRDCDLALIYLLPLGVMATVTLACSPMLVTIASRDPSAAGVVLGPCLVFAASVGVLLLGRLSGIYAQGPADAEGALPTTRSTHDVWDTDARVDRAWTLFEQDSDAALASLEELRREQPSSPQVAQALCLMLAWLGRDEQAIAVAVEAIPLCLARGQTPRAAEIFRALCEKLPQLDTKRDDLVAVGMCLQKSGDLREAANVLVAVLRDHPKETRAIRGLLQLAERNLRPGGLPEDAAAIYRFLLESCPDSAFADDMRRGLAAAERCVGQLTE